MGKNRVTSSSSSASQDASDLFLLQESYRDVTRNKGLTSFLNEVPNTGNNSVKQRELDRLFSATVWQDQSKRGGHRKIKNVVTGVVIEYTSHDNKGNMNRGGVRTIRDQVQEHVNTLQKEIFNSNSWKEKPDYGVALNNLRNFKG